MKSINLFWYKLPDGSSNYGDELNLFIVSELTGERINHIPYPYKWYKVPFIYLNNLMRKRGYASFRGMLHSIFAKNILFAIGSVLQIHDRKGVIVWGSGIIQKNSSVHNATFKAVRGLETVKRLRTLGYDAPVALGDPALLLPLLIAPAKRQRKIGIVPNFKHYDELRGKLTLTPEFSLIDLRDDVQSVTDEITSCEYILATSLHGVVIGQAYNIPTLWVDLNLENKLAGDDIKFSDYFSSVNIKPYKPFSIESFDFEYIKGVMTDNPDKTAINNDLDAIQKRLLKAFPYRLKKKYQL